MHYDAANWPGREIALIACDLPAADDKEPIMPPFLLSPLVKWALIAAGGTMVVHWVVKETRRINEELERARRAARISDREKRPTLRRDPTSGEYRL